MRNSINQFLTFSVMLLIALYVSCDYEMRPQVQVYKPEATEGLKVTFDGLLERSVSGNFEVGFVWSSENREPTLDDSVVIAAMNDDGQTFSKIDYSNPRFADNIEDYYVRAYIKFGANLDAVSYSLDSELFDWQEYEIIIPSVSIINDKIATQGLITTEDGFAGGSAHGHILSARADAVLGDSDLLGMTDFGPVTSDATFVSEFDVNFNETVYARAYITAQSGPFYSEPFPIAALGGWRALEPFGLNNEVGFGISEGFGDFGFIGMGASDDGNYGLWRITPKRDTSYTRLATETSSTTWSKLLGERNSDGVSFAFDSKLYFVWGRPSQGSENTKAMRQYDSTADLWSQPDEMLFPPGEARIKGFAAALNGKAYLGCGLNEQPQGLNDIYTYTPGVGWSDGTVITSPYTKADGRVYGMSAVVLNNELYLLGGNNQGATKECWRYNETTGWHPIEDFPGEPRLDAVAFVLNNKIYYGTGWAEGDLDKMYNDFWIYNPGSGWSSLGVTQPFTGEVRYGATAFVADGKAYVAGGRDFRDRALDDIHVFVPPE